MNRLPSSGAVRQLLRNAGNGSVAAEFRLPGVAAGRHFATTSDEDTHDDFKPQIRGQPSSSVAEQIEADVNSREVFLYMKGVPQAPMCGFSQMACRILDAYGADYGSRDVLADPELREGIKKYTHWPTIPQVFIAGEFVGGSDILMQMHQSGELRTKLEGTEGDKE